MWRKRAAMIVAGVGWGAGASQALPGLPYWMSQPGTMFVLSVAICATGYCALKCHQRPIAQAYDIGYEMGRRDAIRDANRRSVSPVRREPHALAAMAEAARKRYEYQRG